MKQLKQYGQNFLQTATYADKIADLLESDYSNGIIEIGAGSGILSDCIAKRKFKKLHLVEIDPRWAGHLDGLFSSGNIQIINRDFLQYDFGEHWGAADKQLIVVGNIPYYITSEIIFHLLENHRYISRVIMMVQKEVADRLTALTGTKAYGIMTIFLSLAGHVRKVFDIGKENFRPVPKVDSSVVQIDFDKTWDDIGDFQLFEKIVRRTFQARRKKIRNSLINIFGECYLKQIKSIDLNCRPENISPEGYKILANEILNLSFRT